LILVLFHSHREDASTKSDGNKNNKTIATKFSQISKTALLEYISSTQSKISKKSPFIMKCTTVAMTIAAFGFAQVANAFNSHPKNATVSRTLYIPFGSTFMSDDDLTPFLFMFF
jgi:hypothetical protein